MYKKIFPMMLACLLLLLAGCEKYETYGDKKEKERDAIDFFLSMMDIEVISEAEFKAQGETTDTARNQFVRFNRNGVYMQIVRKGHGDKVPDNKTVNLLCRFMEYNIMQDSVIVRNDQRFYMYNSTIGRYDASQFVDKMSVTRTGTTIKASFVSGMMYQYHGSASVPAGWLVPLNYIGIDRPDPAVDSDDEIALVKLIVPHSQGTADATSSVYPCYYEITYVKER
jgi:hypothetical protein